MLSTHARTHCRTMQIHCRTLYIHCRKMFIHCRTLYNHCRTMFKHCRTLYIHCRTMIIHCRTLCIHCHTMFTHCRTPCIHCRTMSMHCQTLYIHCRTLQPQSSLCTRTQFNQYTELHLHPGPPTRTMQSTVRMHTVSQYTELHLQPGMLCSTQHSAMQYTPHRTACHIHICLSNQIRHHRISLMLCRSRSLPICLDHWSLLAPAGKVQVNIILTVHMHNSQT